MKRAKKKIWGRFWQPFTMGYCRQIAKYSGECDICHEKIVVKTFERIRWDRAREDYVEMSDIREWFCPTHGYQMRPGR